MASGYDRGEFSKLSKERLLDYIEQQTEQLNRFETRFRDVVSAYKGVLKEKEALEKTLTALSSQQEEADQEDTGGEKDEEEELERVGKISKSKDGDEEERERDSGDAQMEDKEVSDAGNSAMEPRPEKDEDGPHPEKGGLVPHPEKDSATSESEDGGKSLNNTGSSSRGSTPSSASSIGQLKQRLSTLTTAMATLTEEKSKMKINFQNDKKSMLSQLDQLTNQLHSEKEAAKKEVTRLQNLLTEFQENLRKEQHSRTEDQKNHSEMLKELQNVITLEREQKETLKHKVLSKEAEMDKLQKKIAEDRTREYEENLKIMSAELEQVRSRLMATEKQARQPPPLLLQLQEDMERMKEEHVKSIDAEQRRANDAESRLRLQAEHEELRVASLETKLSDLSKTVGTYDKQKDTDQLAIQRLKERVSQLDSENTALTKAHIERKEASNNEQLSILQEKLAKLKVLLKQATIKINEKATLPSNLEELSVSDYNEILSSQPSRVEYEKELYQLKDEFEKYKTRAQSVLRSRGNKMDSEVTNEEIKKLANENQALRDELVSLQSREEEGEERHLIQTRKLREELRSLHDKNKQKLETMENAYKLKLHELHAQMQSTRERSLKLISERDAEIQSMRSEIHSTRSEFHSLGSHPSTPILSRFKSSIDNNSGSYHSAAEGGEGVASSQGEEESQDSSSGEPNNDTAALSLRLKRSSSSTTNSAVQEILDQPSPTAFKLEGGVVGVAMGGVSEGRLLHYAQEQHRRKEEANLSRKKFFELEDTIRDFQEREQRHIEQTEFLKQEIRKMQRDRSRETENLEYLKNIIIHYMTADSAGREQMINPIATVLHFSRDELTLIKKSIAAKRWLSTNTTK